MSDGTGWLSGVETTTIGVIGGNGGVGASSFAAVLAATAPRSVLVALDPVGGGIDVLLAIEHEPGARWSGLRLDGGRLDPALLDEGLPRWGRVPVLAADVAPPSAAAAGQVLNAVTALGVAVLDLSRAPCAVRDVATLRCVLVVIVAGASARELAAAHAVLAGLPEQVPTGVVVRRGEIAAEQAAAMIGTPLLGRLPALRRTRELDPHRLPRATARLAAGILDGLDGQ